MLNTYRMKAQCSKQTDVPGRLSTIDKRGSSWPLPFGLLMADSGLLLIAFAGWEALRASSQTLLYTCGVILCFAGGLFWFGLVHQSWRGAARNRIAIVLELVLDF
jgi:hypothetical protein